MLATCLSDYKASFVFILFIILGGEISLYFRGSLLPVGMKKKKNQEVILLKVLKIGPYPFPFHKANSTKINS